MAEYLRRLVRWNAWANRQVLATLEAARGEPANALAAFQHVLETEIVWLRRIDSDPRPMIPLWATPLLETCRAFFAEVNERWTSLAANLDDAALQRQVTYRTGSGQEYTDPVIDPLLQTLSHSSQYRGEASGFLNQTPHRVPDLDYIFWLRLGMPG